MPHTHSIQKSIGKNIPYFFVGIFRRAVIFYIFIFLVVHLLVDYERVRFGLKIRILDNMMPDSFHYLIESVEGKELVDQNKLTPFFRFYAKVVGFFPEQSDAWGMLAFCYYHLKDYNRAVVGYQKAMTLEPDYFWYYYNLGTIYYKDNQYAKAAQYFHDAILMDPNEALTFTLNSNVIYRSILRNFKDPKRELMLRIQRGYHQAYLMAVLSCFKSKDYIKMFNVAQKAIKNKVHNYQIFYYFSGLALYQLKEYKKAVVLFNTYIKFDFQHPEPFQYLAWSYQNLGNQLAAQDALSKVSLLEDNKGYFDVPVSLITVRIF